MLSFSFSSFSFCGYHSYGRGGVPSYHGITLAVSTSERLATLREGRPPRALRSSLVELIV